MEDNDNSFVASDNGSEVKNIAPPLSNVMQPENVDKSRVDHMAPANNLQKYIPQNGGQIQAGTSGFEVKDEGNC